MPTLRFDSTELHYTAEGDGPREVLFVHGWMVSGAVFRPLLDALGADGLRCLVPDLPGAGRSRIDGAEPSIERFGRDLIALTDAESLARPVLVGHSMGGQIAQWIASEIPERVAGLALLCPVPATGVPLPEDAAGLFRSSGGDRQKQGTILDLACKELSAADRERLLDDAGAIEPGHVARTFEAWSGASFGERLPRIRARTMVLATDDPFLPPDFLRATVVDRIAGAELQVLRGPGHYPLVEQPAATAAILRTFLAALP